MKNVFIVLMILTSAFANADYKEGSIAHVTLGRMAPAIPEGLIWQVFGIYKSSNLITLQATKVPTEQRISLKGFIRQGQYIPGSTDLRRIIILENETLEVQSRYTVTIEETFEVGKSEISVVEADQSVTELRPGYQWKETSRATIPGTTLRSINEPPEPNGDRVNYILSKTDANVPDVYVQTRYESYFGLSRDEAYVQYRNKSRSNPLRSSIMVDIMLDGESTQGRTPVDGRQIEFEKVLDMVMDYRDRYMGAKDANVRAEFRYDIQGWLIHLKYEVADANLLMADLLNPNYANLSAQEIVNQFVKSRLAMGGTDTDIRISRAIEEAKREASGKIDARASLERAARK
jgi:hypothetical protein